MCEDPDLMVKEQELQEKIEAFIEEEIQPYIQGDGGNLEVLSFRIRSGILRVQLQGACESCPHSQLTLKNGIELRLKEQFPEIKEVEAQKPPSLLDLVDE